MREYVLYGGKGGVGKTTCAAATGLASAAAGDDTLVVSTDPAHSLADAFDTSLGSDPTAVTDGLWALEVAHEAGTDQYQRVFEAVAAELRAAGVRLDDEEIEELFGMGALPGSDEMAALAAFVEYGGEDRFDRVLFDTAPTGHTLRLLDLPRMADKGLSTALSIREQVRRKTDAAKTMLFGPMATMGGRDEATDLADLRADLADVEATLTDPARTEFRVVMTPERLALRETERLVDRLRSFDVPITTLVVNRVVTDADPDCERCRAREERHADLLATARETFSDLEVVVVPDVVSDLQGPEALDPIRRRLD
jgi:arsenite-transporting ATPase